MKLARAISFGMTGLGVLLTILGAALDLSPVITVTGMLLFVAGAVKIAIVQIWQTMFRLPPSTAPELPRFSPPRRQASKQRNEVLHEKLP